MRFLWSDLQPQKQSRQTPNAGTMQGLGRGLGRDVGRCIWQPRVVQSMILAESTPPPIAGRKVFSSVGGYHSAAALHDLQISRNSRSVTGTKRGTETIAPENVGERTQVSRRACACRVYCLSECRQPKMACSWRARDVSIKLSVPISPRLEPL